ncbi:MULTISPECIES: type II secretion system major pseudopilin GspG [Burkholderia]|uniref:Type II secretion system core protein G n=1 Tax=Burkholderia pyrrocinia TaxID=60550 RepID=A0A318IN55_BURPY|nr:MULTISPECIES: type II secretion system major pseudopilin GspG [Burkholderia]PXX25823.1 general secretion pathway protein G [Burkholderia pyrrocinia]SFW83659.1 type II secretion system protein G (GspG) [Burkholderia sp. NFACC33-1]SFY44794.1 type II secretion system protein G (GspG) [Burkholderia sp. NFPP32]
MELIWRGGRRRLGRGISGFTLLELLVVLLIIAVLAGYVGPKLFSQVDKAKVKAAQGQMKTLADAANQFRLDVGRFPTQQEGLDALVIKPSGANGWHGPYLSREVPMDPWGHPYVWRNPGESHEVEIVSLGSDAKPGGAGYAADIVYGF